MSRNIAFDYKAFKKKRDAHIRDLNAAYERNWDRENIELVHGTAHFTGPNVLEVELQDGHGPAQLHSQRRTLRLPPSDIPVISPEAEVTGAQYGIAKEGFFALDKPPSKTTLIGAGYIVIEIAGLWNAGGVEVHMFMRGDIFLKNFDPMILESIMKKYELASGHVHWTYSGITKVERISDCLANEQVLRLRFEDETTVDSNELLWAIVRPLEVGSLKLDVACVKKISRG